MKVESIFTLLSVLSVLAGCLLLILTEAEVVGIVLLVVAVGVLGSIYVRQRTPDIKRIDGHYHVLILDEAGKKARVSIHRRIRAVRTGVNELKNHDLSGTGTQRILKTSIGHIDYQQEGGKPVIITRLDPPMEKGRIVEHCLEIEAIDCFTERRENVSATIYYPQPSIDLSVQLPLNRPASSARAFIRQNEKNKDWPVTVVCEGCFIHARFYRLKPGTVCVVEWVW